MIANAIDEVAHQKANPLTAIELETLGSIFHRIMIRVGWRCAVLSYWKKQFEPKGSILFAGSTKVGFGTELKDTGHEDAQHVQTPRTKSACHGTIGSAIEAVMCFGIEHVPDLQYSMENVSSFQVSEYNDIELTTKPINKV